MSTGDKLKGTEFLVSTTIGGPEDSYCETGCTSFTIGDLLKPLRQISNLTVPDMRITALLLLLLCALHTVSARAGDKAPPAAEKPAVINAWAVDIPSPATVTKIEGVIVILNRTGKKYVLLEEGSVLGFDDIIRMLSAGKLEVRYEDGSHGTFAFRDFPENPEGPGTWIVFKEQQ